MAQETGKQAELKGPELRLLDRRAFVGFPELKVAPGVMITDFALQIPDVTFPFNVSGGATRYQKKKLDFGYLDVSIDAEVIVRRVHDVAGKLESLDDLKLHFRPGYLEAQARLRTSERATVTFKIAFDAEADRLAVYLYDVRFYAFSTTPAARLPALISQAVKDLDLLPDVERRGANGFSARVLPALVELAAVGRGYKMPNLDQARLSEAIVSSKGLKLRFSSGGLPPPANYDEELLLALEGARAFSDAEEFLAEGKLEEARAAYLKLGDAQDAHPFAAERLLTLLVADPQSHELALDVAASLFHRRDRSATALWAEAVVRERRGEFARAAERYLTLCNLARQNHDEASAFFAAEAGARSSRDHAPQMAVKALHELLGLKPDHLPSLKALARASDQAKDRAGAIRAYRRLAALARDPAEAADAHVQLARLCAQTEDDIAGARLHCEAALRLKPDHPDALLQLGELCFKGQEHLRAIKALDRLREVAMGRHEVDRVGRANLLAGQVWELGLKQLDNALLRYREAVSLLPSESEPHYLLGRAAEALGKIQEALTGYQQAIELAGAAPSDETARRAAHSAHHALARLYKTKLGEPSRAREHLEGALGLEPQDLAALDELLPYFRAAGKAAELADACEKAAAVLEDPRKRAALWAEAGELYRSRLGQTEKAERLLGMALDADPKNRIALEGMLALAEARRDGNQLCRCLRELADLAEDPKEKMQKYRRLAVAARDLSFDLDLAVHAYREVLKVEPDDLPVLGELCALERRRSDMAGLAWALEQRARSAETNGDKRLAAAALRELGQVLETRLGRPGEALVAFEKAARLFPEVNALLDLANLSLRAERPQNARRALEDVLTLLPKHAAPEKMAEVRARLGKACDLLGDKDAAREHYALAFPLRRLDDDLAARLEALYEEAGLTRELTDLWGSRGQALLAAGRAVDAAPLFFKSAQALLKVGDTPGAILRLNAALDAAPHGEKAAHTVEAMAELEEGRSEKLEAAKLWARRATFETEGRAAARFLFRAATLATGNAREESYLVEALRQDSNYVPARRRRLDLVYEHDPKTALADIEAILGVDAKDPDAVSSGERLVLVRKAGFAAIRAKQFDTARRHFSLYSAHRPDDLEVLLELVQLYRQAKADEPLLDLLGELWPRLEGEKRRAFRREYTEGALKLSRTQEAALALRSMLEDAPDDAWAATHLLELLPIDESSVAERLALISLLADSAKGEARAGLLEKRAELLRYSGKLEQARDDLLEAAKLSTRSVSLLRALAETSRQANDETGELNAWKLLLERGAGDASITAEAGERLLAIAYARAAQKDHPAAREAFELAARLELRPNDRFEVFFGLAQTAQALGDSARAESALWEASKQGPAAKRVEALLTRAASLEARRSHVEASQSFEAALALAPRHVKATDGLKRNLRAVNDWASLAEVLSTEANQAPKDRAAPLFAELAALYLDRLSLVGPGEAALRRVATLDETDVPARRRLAELLSARGEVDAAAELLEEASGQLPDDEAAEVLREGAEMAQRASSAALALRLARKAHQLSPASGEHLEFLADVLYLHGALKEALPLLASLADEDAFADAPEAQERVLLRLADVAEQCADKALAEKTLRRLVRDRPWHEPAVERLAALVEARNPREALGLLAEHARALVRSPRAAQRLLALARRVRAQLADVDLALSLYRQAAEYLDSPLEVRQEIAGYLREVNRTPELAEQLSALAQIHFEQGHLDAAVNAWQEQSQLALELGQVDQALATLHTMAEALEEDGDVGHAAQVHMRSAQLLADSKLDLAAADQALQKSWELDHSPETAQLGMALARRRTDREAEIDWLERTLDGQPSTAQKAQRFVQLARLHLGLAAEGAPLQSATWNAPEQAEAALKQALLLQPGFADAESLLLAVLEHQDRLSDVAQYFEESAQRSQSPVERARLLMRAAEIYKDRADEPHAAAAALLAARAANPDDTALTSRVADALHQLGRVQEAADFDSVLLEQDPFHASFERHKQYLTQSKDVLGLATLLSRRAEKESGDPAAARWLEAAAAFAQAGAAERARVCEDQAFEAAPANEEAFARLMERAKGDAKRTSDLLAMRAKASPQDAAVLLRERALTLTRAGEALEAADAWDEYLATVPNDVEALQTRADLAAQSSGARAAQPYDRRVLQAGGQSLAPAARLKALSRLGHAALESKAFRDAAELFEQAFSLEPDSERGREALSLLVEAYTLSQDKDGLYRATVRLADRAADAERYALLRQAAALYSDAPAKALDALRALVKAFPAEVELYQRQQKALTSAGLTGELLALHESFAQAAGGPQGAQALLDGADLAETELRDAPRALELRRQAALADPSNTRALELVAQQQRGSGDDAALAKTLGQLIAVLPAPASEARLELAAVLEKSGDFQGARATLEVVRQAGTSAPGYSAALLVLERVVAQLGDALGVGEVLVARAELLQTDERAAAFLKAAQSFREAKNARRALEAARSALSERSSLPTLQLVAELSLELDEPARAAVALVQAAGLTQGQARAATLLKAAEAWETAGEKQEARDLIERVLRDFPDALEPADAAARLGRLGDVGRAAEVAFTPAMEQGDFEEALRLSDLAKDSPRIVEALWALAERGDVKRSRRLADLLRGKNDLAGLEQLASLAESELADELNLELFIEHASSNALERLQKRRLLGRAVEAVISASRPAALEKALSKADQIAPELREKLWSTAREQVPAQRSALTRLLADDALAQERFADAARWLGELAGDEKAGPARAAVELQRGVLLLEKLNDAAAARAAFERALADDPQQTAALTRLVELVRSEPERFAELVERLEASQGEQAIAPFKAELARTYETLGRDEDAYRVLAQLPESDELFERRAKVALKLGLTGEALQLQEKFARGPEREAILKGYLEIELVPFASRLAEKLLEENALPAELMRFAAERLSSQLQGAAVAVKLWPKVFGQGGADTDGWTLYGEALRLLGREADALLADGFGAALTASHLPAAMLRPEAVDAPSAYRFPPLPAGLLPVDDVTMPRLAAILSDALTALGARGVSVLLDPSGGAEAYLGATNALVLGVGALAVFGPSELSYLCALALALGEDGYRLRGAEDIDGFDDAAVAAFDAYPSSLAAGRVLALLDSRVRGRDPAAVDQTQVLSDSGAYEAVAQRALERLTAKKS